MKHDRRLSQICKAWCAQCGNNVTTTAYNGIIKPFVTAGIDWSSNPNDLDSLMAYHHAAIFTIIINSKESANAA